VPTCLRSQRFRGDTSGILKLLVPLTTDACSRRTSSAPARTELIHPGQCVVFLEGTIDHFIDAAFNYSTLATAYRVAALDAANKIDAFARLGV
jgi:NAD(P) transhydrogenase